MIEIVSRCGETASTTVPAVIRDLNEFNDPEHIAMRLNHVILFLSYLTK